MKKILILFLVFLLTSCVSEPEPIPEPINEPVEITFQEYLLLHNIDDVDYHTSVFYNNEYIIFGMYGAIKDGQNHIVYDLFVKDPEFIVFIKCSSRNTGSREERIYTFETGRFFGNFPKPECAPHEEIEVTFNDQIYDSESIIGILYEPEEPENTN